MRKFTLAVLGLVASLLAVPTLSSANAIVSSDQVVIVDFFYGNSVTNVPESGENGPVFVGNSAIYGIFGAPSFDVYLLERNTNIISDHLYSAVGTDSVYFSSDPSADPLIGTVYTGDRRFAIYETGTLQDVSAIIEAQIGNQIFAGGTISVSSDVPEPSTAALLALGGLGLAIRAIRRRKAAAV